MSRAIASFSLFWTPSTRNSLPGIVATLLKRLPNVVTPLIRFPPPSLSRPLSTSSTSTSPSRLVSLLSTHYHTLDPSIPLRHHLSTASQELKWLEQRARSTGLGSGNWETLLESYVKEIVQFDKPLAYILGTQPFHPLPVDLLVRPPILVPRPETEHWVQHLSQTLLSSNSSRDHTTSFKILDIGTGTGCIALGLTKSLLNSSRSSLNGESESRVECLGIDRSEQAVELARENTRRCLLTREVKVRRMDLFNEEFVENVLRRDQEEGREGGGEGEKGFDLIVSNPPYITRREFEGLDKSVKNWEDRSALVGESPTDTEEGKDDGLIFYRRISSILNDLLRKPITKGGRGGPVVAFEVGKGQAREVGALLRRQGFKSEIVSDPWGVERAVFGWRR